ncbi:MAG: thiamine pyrophosphate-binding protein, partial [Dehalococcoidia bacterium]|nr:thiamine pyrophosphate-binding protein [Dehalococcoidia bacterium]
MSERAPVQPDNSDKSESVSKAKYGSDVIVELLKSVGIEHVAVNPGSSFRGLHDSLVNFGGDTGPDVILACHEEIAVSIAHGYAKATGKPMAVVVHDIVGLQHATMAIYNAWCDRVPVMVLGATGPMDSTKRRPHGDWIHTALIQGNLVRDFVKWDDQPFCITNVPDSFLRAHKLMMTEPKAPVYLCYDINLQEDELSGPVPVPPASRYAAPSPIQAESSALLKAAQWLVRADNPVIIADCLGRNPGA